MSYILESIKQAERERKAGKAAPSISIEYTGEHLEDIEANKLQWMMLAIGLSVTAIIVWSATYYFSHKDQNYIAEISASKVVSAPVKQTERKRDVVLKPVKNVHTSNLKSVTFIDDEEVLAVKNTSSEQNNSVAESQNKSSGIAVEEKYVAKNVSKAVPALMQKNKIDAKAESLKTEISEVENGFSGVSGKNELVAIYSDLAKLAEHEPASVTANEFEQNLQHAPAQIEPVNNTVLEPVEIKTNHSAVNTGNAVQVASTSLYKEQHQQAVSSGVPSFGELPYTIQERIPDFKVSVHMFHADPLQRKIRINGHMYTEGKSVQQDLALVEITRYGAVFDYQGHLFRYNVR